MKPLLTALTFAALTSCTTDQPKGPIGVEDAGGQDAGAPVAITAHADAGAPAADAGSQPIVDAGDAAAASTLKPAGEPQERALGKSTPFDRVLAKPRVPTDVQVLKGLVEQRTGQKVALVRKTAGKWVLFQFEGKGRDAQAQAQLVDVMREMDAFASVEADRLMKVKTP